MKGVYTPVDLRAGKLLTAVAIGGQHLGEEEAWLDGLGCSVIRIEDDQAREAIVDPECSSGCWNDRGTVALSEDDAGWHLVTGCGAGNWATTLTLGEIEEELGCPVRWIEPRMGRMRRQVWSARREMIVSQAEQTSQDLREHLGDRRWRQQVLERLARPDMTEEALAYLLFAVKDLSEEEAHAHQEDLRDLGRRLPWPARRGLGSDVGMESALTRLGLGHRFG